MWDNYYNNFFIAITAINFWFSLKILIYTHSHRIIWRGIYFFCPKVKKEKDVLELCNHQPKVPVPSLFPSDIYFKMIALRQQIKPSQKLEQLPNNIFLVLNLLIMKKIMIWTLRFTRSFVTKILFANSSLKS